MNTETLSLRSGLMGLLADLGVLRILLVVLGLIAIVFAPASGAKIVYEGWGLVRTAVLPAIGPIILQVVLLDMLMTRVWMVEAEPERLRQLRRVMWVEGLLVLSILLAWVPFILYLAGLA